MKESLTMESSFDFLKDNSKLEGLYKNLRQTERLYSLGFFSQETTTLRSIAEQLAKKILEANRIKIESGSTFASNLRQLKNVHIDHKIIDLFYTIKDIGNQSAHNLTAIPKDQALV